MLEMKELTSQCLALCGRETHVNILMTILIFRLCIRESLVSGGTSLLENNTAVELG